MHERSGRMNTDTKEFAMLGFGEYPAFALNTDLQPCADCPSNFKIRVAVDCEVEALWRYLTLERAA